MESSYLFLFKKRILSLCDSSQTCFCVNISRDWSSFKTFIEQSVLFLCIWSFWFQDEELSLFNAVTWFIYSSVFLAGRARWICRDIKLIYQGGFIWERKEMDTDTPKINPWVADDRSAAREWLAKFLGSSCLVRFTSAAGKPLITLNILLSGK